MKNPLLSWVVATFAAPCVPIASAAPRTLNLRAVTMAGGYPVAELYAHSGGKEAGS